MFTFFGTTGQELLLMLHRYSALLLSLFAIVYLYLSALSEMKGTGYE
jgi:preprotein translocase subunit SecG